MMRRLLAGLLLALLAVALLLPAAPADAAHTNCSGDVQSYSGSAAESLCWPLQQDSTLVIEGPATIWKMRAFAERLDAVLPRLDIVSGSCASAPDAFCLTVGKSYAGGQRYAGWTSWSPDGRSAHIDLNLTYKDSPAATKRRTAAHELLHVLGFRHHGEEGIIGARTPASALPAPTAAEWAALNGWYAS